MREFKLIFKSGYSRTAIIRDNINSDYIIIGYYTGMVERTPLALSDTVVKVEVL